MHVLGGKVHNSPSRTQSPCFRRFLDNNGLCLNEIVEAATMGNGRQEGHVLMAALSLSSHARCLRGLLVLSRWGVKAVADGGPFESGRWTLETAHSDKIEIGVTNQHLVIFIADVKKPEPDLRHEYDKPRCRTRHSRFKRYVGCIHGTRPVDGRGRVCSPLILVSEPWNLLCPDSMNGTITSSMYNSAQQWMIVDLAELLKWTIEATVAFCPYGKAIPSYRRQKA